MELTEAEDQARLIFENEQDHPTLDYRYISSEWPEEMRYERNPQWSPAGAGMMALPRIRNRFPREVYENPNNWQLESINYTLIMAICSQLSEWNRGLFLGGFLNVWTRKYIPHRTEAQHWWPSWNGHTSALPLLAEFCIRNGRLKLLLDVLNNVEMPTPSVAVMFKQLSEMITLNFNVFTDAELAAMPEALKMEEAFVTSLYTLVSDEAIHPTVAQREYARIRRNMIIEYGLMFLSVLDKKGFKVS